MALGDVISEDDTFDLGHILDQFLDQLARSELHIGPRERSAAHVIALRWLAEQTEPASNIAALRPLLAPILARSPEERLIFSDVFERFLPSSTADTDEIDIEVPEQNLRRWFVIALTVLAVLIAVFGAYSPQQTDVVGNVGNEPEIEISEDGSLPPPIRPPAAAIKDEPLSVMTTRLLGQVSAAGEKYSYAPTLNELSFELKSTPAARAELAALMSHYTGLPRDEPIALLGLEENNSDVWVRISLALGRDLNPSDEQVSWNALKARADRVLQTTDRQRVYRIAGKLDELLEDAPDEAESEIALLERIAADEDIGPGPAQDVKRAFALLGKDTSRFETLPWTSRPPRTSQAAPSWLLPVAVSLPLFFALWFATSLALKRAYLRQRTPKVPPTQTDLVSNAGQLVRYPAHLVRRAGQKLLTRTPKPSTRLDIGATISTSLHHGGMITPVYAGTSPLPEYLVLIQRQSSGDQDASRMYQMVERLSELLSLDIYFYQTDVAELEAVETRQRISIEQAQAKYPEHRLLIMGDASGFLDPVSMELRGPARQLLHWQRRALLSPVPLAEWGEQEYTLSDELSMPIGRATPEGLAALSGLLGLDGAEASERLSVTGDGLARPLPDILRNRPQRFLFNHSPGNKTIDDVLRELRNYLDAPTFDWLAALAVYPAIQWDLTLFLGVNLPKFEGENAETNPLYDEDRLAALTQLPWLKAGRMPNWLREALISKLSPARRAEVQIAIEKALNAARPEDQLTEDKLLLTIGRDSPKEPLRPEELLEDQVLLDFLTTGGQSDFALSRFSRLADMFDRTFWERLGGPTGLALAGAIAYALAALITAPRASQGAVFSGAYAPLAILFFGGAVAIGVWYWRGASRSLLSALERAAPGAFALLFALLIPGFISQIPPLNTVPSLLFQILGAAAIILYVAGGLLAARFLAELIDMRVFAQPLSNRQGQIEFAVKVALLSALLWMQSVWVNAVDGRSPLLARYFIYALPLLVLLGIAASKWLQRLSRPHVSARGNPAESPNHSPQIIVAAIPVIASLGFYWHVHSTHDRFALLSEPITSAAIEHYAESSDASMQAFADEEGNISVRIGDQEIANLKSRIGRLSSLIIGGESTGQKIAVAGTSGKIMEWMPGGPPAVSNAPPSAGSVPRIAYGPNAELWFAIETPDGKGEIALGDKTLQTSSPVAALTAIDSGRAAAAFFDKTFLLIEDSGDALTVSRLGGPLARHVAQRLSYHKDDDTLSAVLMDQTIWQASLTESEPIDVPDEDTPPDPSGWTTTLTPFSTQRVGDLGGTLAVPGEWPYLGVIRGTKDDQEIYFCGVSVISDRWALAAAHCLSSATPTRENMWEHDSYGALDIAIGVSDLQEIDAGSIFGIASIIVHPKYIEEVLDPQFGDWQGPSNDLVLIELDRDWEGPILRLSASSYSDPDRFYGRAFSAGFGIQNPSGRNQVREFDISGRRQRGFAGSTNLIQKSLPLKSSEECEERLSTHGFHSRN